jgi:HD-like signal output (HDOD) protein
MSANTKQALQWQVNSLRNLPVLPEASLRILEAINTPDVCLDKLVVALSLSPGLVARLLGLANSAYFSRGKCITDLRAAVFQVLGMDLVKVLATGVIFNVQFDTAKCRAFDSEYFWTRSLITAVSAQKLASEVDDLQDLTSSAIYTSGLLLNIGILVLGYAMPEQLNDILLHCKKNNLSINDEITRQLSQSHFQLGGMAATGVVSKRTAIF